MASEHLSIGQNIAALRRQQGVTQEQLASAVGVTAPAVSKWESGQSCPDIALLAPLARYFGVSVDLLLSYAGPLTPEEALALEERCAAVFERDFAAGLAACRAALREYPRDGYLAFRLAGLLLGKAVLAQGAEEQQALLDLQRQLLDLALQADDARVRQGAQTLLVSHYMAASQPEKAEELLSAVPVPDTDPRLMLVSLYQAQGRGEEAEKLAQRLLYDQLCGAMGVLPSLARSALGRGDAAFAACCCDAMDALCRRFKLPANTRYSASLARLTLALHSKEAEALLAAAQRLVDDQQAILAGGEAPNSPFFDKLEWKIHTFTPKERQAQAVFLQKLLTGEPFAPLKSDPRHAALLQQVEEAMG